MWRTPGWSTKGYGQIEGYQNSRGVERSVCFSSCTCGGAGVMRWSHGLALAPWVARCQLQNIQKRRVLISLARFQLPSLRHRALLMYFLWGPCKHPTPNFTGLREIIFDITNPLLSSIGWWLPGSCPLVKVKRHACCRKLCNYLDGKISDEKSCVLYCCALRPSDSLHLYLSFIWLPAKTNLRTDDRLETSGRLVLRKSTSWFVESAQIRVWKADTNPLVVDTVRQMPPCRTLNLVPWNLGGPLEICRGGGQIDFQVERCRCDSAFRWPHSALSMVSQQPLMSSRLGVDHKAIFVAWNPCRRSARRWEWRQPAGKNGSRTLVTCSDLGVVSPSKRG